MAFPDWSATFTLVVLVTLSSLQALVQLRAIWRLRTRVKGWCRSLCARARGDADASRPASSAGTIESQVTIHFYRRRTALYKAFVGMWKHLIGVSLIWATIMMLLAIRKNTEVFLYDNIPHFLIELSDSTQVRTNEEGPTYWLVSYGLYQTGFHVFYFLVCASLSHNDADQVERTKQDVFHLTVILFISLISIFFPCYWWADELLLIRMGLAVVHKSMRQTVAGNLVISACRRYQLSILSLIAPSYPIKMEWVNVCGDHTFKEGLVFFMIVGVSWMVEKLAWEEAHAAIQAKSSTNEHKALASILSATCDSVVRLDADMRVVGPNPNLEAMLLKSKNSVHGVDFSSLISSSAVAGLVKDLAQTKEQSTEGVSARIFRTSMRDADGNTIPYHAYDTVSQDLEGGLLHIIGL
jgi:PAS domain-containing protein